MRIALLGVDEATLAVATAAARDGHDEIVIDASAARAAEAKSIARSARMIADWENALDTNSVDAVVVAANQPSGDQPDLRIEQLRRLIQTGIPTLVSHPINLSMLECYELEMIREESRSIVLPYLPARWHPVATEMHSLVEQGKSSAMGGIEQVVFERFLPQRNREGVLRQFAIDADLMQFVAGDATKMHALGSGTGTSVGPYANLTVQMTCEQELVCRWCVSPVEDQPGGRLTLVGSQGKSVLWMPEDHSPWRLEIRTLPNATVKDYVDWDPASTALAKLAAAREGEPVDPTWAEAARTVELAETIDRSLARGRTIDLHREEFTDIGTFKGTMTSIGCGLLVAGLVLVVLVAMLHLLAVQAGWVQLANLLDRWPYLLLLVCGIYLLLQPLAFIGKSERKTTAPPSNQSSSQGPDGES